MNYAAAEVNSLMKMVVGEQTSTICIFYVAFHTDKLLETVSCPQSSLAQSRQMKHY